MMAGAITIDRIWRAGGLIGAIDTNALEE